MYTAEHTHTRRPCWRRKKERDEGEKKKRKKKRTARTPIGQGLRLTENEFNWSAHCRPSSSSPRSEKKRIEEVVIQ